MICLHRSVENPDVVVEADLHFSPTSRGPSARELPVLHHAVDDSGVSLVPKSHIKYWRRRASAVARPLELRRQTVQSRSIQESMATKASAAPNNISTTSNDIREFCLRATTKENGLRSQENTLEAHSRIIEASIHAAVLSRLQYEQQLREQAIQENIEEARRLQRIQEDEDQLNLAAVSTIELSNEHSPGLPELDLDCSSLRN